MGGPAAAGLDRRLGALLAGAVLCAGGPVAVNSGIRPAAGLARSGSRWRLGRRARTGVKHGSPARIGTARPYGRCGPAAPYSAPVRSSRTLYAAMVAAAVLLLLSVLVQPPWLQLLLTVLAIGAGVLAAVVLVQRRQDPNGPPGQH